MDFTYIDTEKQLQDFIKQNQRISWMAFDTEFVGEKRYHPLLCLIQVVTEFGSYIIDPIQLQDIGSFLQLIENDKIVKITHAGDNDYRLLNNLFGIVPKNIFDTQVAAAFTTTTYPISFQKLADRELKVRIPKGFTVTDWELRPLNPKHLQYAINDVIYLPKLWEILSKKLEEGNRLVWLKDELSKLEKLDYYEVNPLKEALQSNLLHNLAFRDQIFLVRLLAWRRAEAEKRNISKEMMLPSKSIGMIVKNIHEGKAALKHNRMISDKLMDKNWDTFNELYQSRPTEEEKVLFEKLPKMEEETPTQVLSFDFLHLLIRSRCLEQNIAHSLVLPKSSLRDIVENELLMNELFTKSWRKELLGDTILTWIKDHRPMHFVIEDDHCKVTMENGVM
ncbi:MAG: ribonuclease D [Saprospiraceae bacterium]